MKPRHENIVYLNGDLIAADRARVPLLDRGYLYGEGLFETMRSYGGRIFALDRHLARLTSSAAELGLHSGGSEKELARALELTLEANGLADAYLRLTVSQQCDAPGVESRAAGKFTVSVIARPLAARQREGISLVTLDSGSAPSARLARHKTLSFLAYVQARAKARTSAADDALLINAAGEITEATTANVFFVMEGRLVTPALACGLLPGITRAIVMELARGRGIEVIERRVSASELAAASECFLTNSVGELIPVISINSRPVGAGAPGKIWAALSAAYSRAAMSTSGS